MGLGTIEKRVGGRRVNGNGAIMACDSSLDSSQAHEGAPSRGVKSPIARNSLKSLVELGQRLSPFVLFSKVDAAKQVSAQVGLIEFEDAGVVLECTIPVT